MAILGADVDQLDQAARAMAQGGDRARTQVAQIDQSIGAAWWVGANADEFRRWWTSAGRHQVTAVADLLATQSAVLAQQATQQRQASDLGGAGGPPGVAGGGPGGVLPGTGGGSPGTSAGDPPWWQQAIGAEFFNLFGANESFPLIPLVLAGGKMTRMARGIPPIFQTGGVGRRLLPFLASRAGNVGAFGTWLGSPAGRLLTTRVGIVGGVVGTGTGLYDLYQQGNPIDAFEREGAGYVADVASTAFSASTTAFLVAPNPVTGALAVGTGLVWAGAEVVDHWDDITEFGGDVWDGAVDLGGAWVDTQVAVAEAGVDLASDAWDAGTDLVGDVGGGIVDGLTGGWWD